MVVFQIKSPKTINEVTTATTDYVTEKNHSLRYGCQDYYAIQSRKRRLQQTGFRGQKNERHAVGMLHLDIQVGGTNRIRHEHPERENATVG